MKHYNTHISKIIDRQTIYKGTFETADKKSLQFSNKLTEKLTDELTDHLSNNIPTNLPTDEENPKVGGLSMFEEINP